MFHECFTKNAVYAVVTGLAGLCGLIGCAPHDYKSEADKKVYDIIDRKWEKNFGPKVNYKISDTQASPADIQIEKAAPSSGVLTLSQAVALATAHNRQYQLEKEALYIKALDLTLVRHQFEPQLFGGASVEYKKEGDNEINTGEADLGFNQLLADGAFITTNVAAAWVDILSGDLRGGLSSILAASVTQPLLRGSGRKIIRENLTQAERDTLYQIRLFNRFRKTFVVSIISQYHRTLQLFDAAQNAADNYNVLVRVYEHAEKLSNVGRLPRYELDQAHQDKLRARDSLILAEKEYRQALDEFKISLSLPPNTEFVLDENELKALKKASMPEPNFSEADAIKTALSQRLDLANSIDIVADAERKVVVAADSLRAGLNLVASTDVISGNGADPRTLKASKDSAGVGLALDLPLDRVAERNTFRLAQITLAQRQREKDETADTVILEVRQAYRDLIEAAKRYRVQSESLELARKRFDNTFLLLQYRRANTRDVLDAQRDLFRAQDAATAALIDYTVATLNFYRDTEILQVCPDGMWKR